MIVFMVDAATGPTPADQDAAELLRRTTKPVLVAANKADNEKRELDAAEFYAFGWEETFAISANHGRGVGDLLDAIVWALPPESRRRDGAQDARGRGRRVGRRHGGGPDRAVRRRARATTRSTATRLTTATRTRTRRRRRRGRALGRDDGRRGRRAAGDRVRRAARTSASRACSTRSWARRGRSCPTRRAPPATPSTRRSLGAQRGRAHRHRGHPEAGQGRVGPGGGAYSTLRALKAISRADVAVLVLDAADGLTAQDAHVAGYVIEEGKGLVIAVNKWDIVEDKTHKTFDEFVGHAPARAAVHRLRPGRLDQRQDRPARAEGARARGRRLGRATPARSRPASSTG